MLLIKRVFDYFIWLMFFVLLLLGGVIFVTDRTYPGDYLYPFKLKFESFALATSKILNKQVDFSIDLVTKRSNEVVKILTLNYGRDSLNRLDTQVELTANSISEITDPAEKKRAAEKYIVKLNEVSFVLAKKQKDIIVIPQKNVQNIIPTVPLPMPTSSPAVTTVSQQIDNSQKIIDQTIKQMKDEIANQSAGQNVTPTLTNTPPPTPTITPIPTSVPVGNFVQGGGGEANVVDPTATPIPTSEVIPTSTATPTSEPPTPTVEAPTPTNVP
jgi:hypothetical protein